MRPMRMIGSIVAILVAGAVAYVSYAAGEAGPTVVFGRGDANRAAEDAWHQLPVHAALALGVAVAGPTGVRSIMWLVSFIGLVAMSLFAAFLLIVGLTYSGDYTDALDVVVSAVLFVLYGGALILSSAYRA